MKTFHAVCVALMAYMVIHFAYDWYTETPADWIVWWFAICAAIHCGADHAAKWTRA